MSAKITFLLFAQALLVHVAFSQCVYPRADFSQALLLPSADAASFIPLGDSGLANPAGLGHEGCFVPGRACGNIQAVPITGGHFHVSSTAALAPSGLSIVSENVFEGNLDVIGQLPFLGAVAFEGVLPSAGAGIVSFGCGNGVTAITRNAGDFTAGLGLAGISDAAGYGTGILVYPPAGPGLAGGYACVYGGY